MQIGFIGLGDMGGALARRLHLTHPLVVFDLSEAARRGLAEAGATPSATAADLAGQCEVIFLCLPTSDHVRAAIFGENGIARALKPGTLIVDQTTGDPKATRAIAAELAPTGVELIDAPVSGGSRGAQAGTIAIMVGATPEQYAWIHPILSSISPNLFHAGGLGAGHVAKLINNLVSGVQRLLTFESVALAAKNGVEPRAMLDILLAGGGKNAFMERSMGHVLEGDMGPGFTLGLMHKDLRLACQLGADSGVPLLIGNVAKELYQVCIAMQGRDVNVNEAIYVIDRLAGTTTAPLAQART